MYISSSPPTLRWFLAKAFCSTCLSTSRKRRWTMASGTVPGRPAASVPRLGENLKMYAESKAQSSTSLSVCSWSSSVSPGCPTIMSVLSVPSGAASLKTSILRLYLSALYPVRARLHGQVEALYYGLPLPDGPQRAVLHVGRVARRKPHARRLLRDGLEKVAESLAFVSPRVHRLTQERYVSGAASDEALHLPEHTLHRAADHTPPHRRDYAVTALVVAPGHYRDEGVVPALRARQLRRVRLLHGRKAHELGQLVGIMGAKDEVYVVGLLEGRRFLGGADAACEGHPLDATFAAETV